MQRLHKPVKFIDKFVKPSKLKKTTLLDICGGEIDHINLKEIVSQFQPNIFWSLKWLMKDTYVPVFWRTSNMFKVQQFSYQLIVFREN